MYSDIVKILEDSPRIQKEYKEVEMEAVIKIKEKEYLPQQQMLINIWNEHLRHIADGLNLGFITFTKKRPKNPKSDSRRIAGLKAESVLYLKDDRELVKMSEENFIYLMAKMGVDIEISELTK